MVNNSGKHGKQTRKGVTIQLVAGVDDDLIEAITGIEDKGRQATLKKWLRESQGFATAISEQGLDLDQREALQYLVEHAVWTKTALEDLPGYLNHLLSNMTPRPGSPFATPTPLSVQEGVSQEILDKRAERLNKRKW